MEGEPESSAILEIMHPGNPANNHSLPVRGVMKRTDVRYRITRL